MEFLVLSVVFVGLPVLLLALNKASRDVM